MRDSKNERDGGGIMYPAPELTPRQADALRFIAGYIRENGYPPVDREIAAGMGIHDTKTVHRHVNALLAKGYITKDGDRKRSFALTGSGMERCADGACAPTRA